jgi:hypothetical protein
MGEAFFRENAGELPSASLRNGTPREMHEEGQEQKHEEHKEDDFGDTRCSAGNTAETECGRYQRDHKKS